jgi:non-specific protein-tyrosine kinase
VDGRDPQFNVGQYLAIVRRRWAWLTVPPLLALIVSLLMTAQADRIFSATAEVRFRNAGEQGDDIPTEIEIITSSTIRDRVREELTERQLASLRGVRATKVADADIARINVRGTSRAAAALAANSYATNYIGYRQETDTRQLLDQAAELRRTIDEVGGELTGKREQLQVQESLDVEDRDLTLISSLEADIAALEEQQRDLGDQALEYELEAAVRASQVEVAEPANTPGAPVSPKPFRSALTAVIVGLLLGCSLLVIAEFVDDRILSAEDATRWAHDLPVIATLPTFGRGDEPGVIALRDPQHPVSEAYRVLRTSLQFLSLQHEVRRIIVTSPSAGEGKTTTVANLAVTAARADQRVLAVDADLRRSTLHTRFGLSDFTGLTSIVLGTAAPADAIQHVHGVPANALSVLPAGPLPPNPAEVTGSRRFAATLASLAATRDLVIIDSAPVLPVSDTMALAPNADGVLIVARARSTRGRALSSAITRLQTTGVHILGIVINGGKTGSGIYGYGYGYGAPESETSRWPRWLSSAAD